MKICFCILIASINSIFGNTPVKKSGKVPNRSPCKVRSCSSFLPYNPKILVVDPDPDELIGFAKMREKGKVFCLIENNNRLETIKEFNNIKFLSCKTKKPSEYYNKADISKIDVLSINTGEKGLEALEKINRLIPQAIAIFITTQPKSINNIRKQIEKYNFTMISHWEFADKSGRALFVSTPFYKGVYERRPM